MTASGAAIRRGPVATRVVVTVGTDHHQFDRLIRWINAWLEQHPEQVGTFFVQSGAASVRPACAAEPFLDADQLDAVLDRAGVVVCHGGPGSIADAWERGHLPIVVPRLRRYGEVVDDHQVDFCVKLAELGRVRLAQTAGALGEFLEDAAGGTLRAGVGASGADVEAAVMRFAALVDELVSRPRRRLQLHSRAGRVRRGSGTNAGTPTSVDSLPPGDVPDRTMNGVGLAGVPKEEQE